MPISKFVSRKSIALGAILTLVAAPALAVGVIGPGKVVRPYVEFLRHDYTAEGSIPARPPTVLGWQGVDLDGDGAPDIANPTGLAPRTHDAFGDGAFGASRDGGERRHVGVDYTASAGQAVMAPISGFVSKIGYAYADDENLRYVEIENPALKLTARVFYVAPQVEVGQAVRLGKAIGTAEDLQPRYRGITEHVHLEVADAEGRKLDAATMIHARLDRGLQSPADASLNRTVSGD